MTNHLVTVTLPHANGLPADAAVFTSAWARGTAPTLANATALRDAWDGYLNDVAPGAVAAVGGYLSSCLARGAGIGTFDLYTIPASAGPLGSPTFSLPIDFTAVDNSNRPLPSEVAVRCSLHADLTGIPEEMGSARPRARRRGGWYLGPCQAGVSNATNGMTAEPQVSAGCRTDLIAAVQQLAAIAFSVPDLWVLSVFSRVDWAVREVVGGWIDTAFDTQRRRGADATARQTFLI